MAGPATALLAAYNGKPSQAPGNNYGGYNPFSTASATATDPGAQAQNDVATSQANYQSQQDTARSQLQANLQPSSVGGNLSDPNSTYQTNNNVQSGQQTTDPFAQFNNLITQVNQTGQTATDASNLAEQTSWQNKLSGLANTYNQNISQPASWSSDQVDSILGKLGISANPAGSYGLSANSAGQYNVPLPAGADPNSLGARAVQIAQTVARDNVPYVWGGNSLTQGVDCSGLVQQVYGRLGIQLPRTSTEQAKYGKVVPTINQALPGDLILMYSPYESAGLQQFGHVGIYIGNGLMIDAAHTGTNVRIEQISNMTKIVRPW